MFSGGRHEASKRNLNFQSAMWHHLKHLQVKIFFTIHNYMQARSQSLPCYHNGGGSNRRYTPLEAGLVQEGTYFLMEEYTFRLSVLYFKDLGQLDKNVGELLPSQIEGLVQDGHLQNAHASLL